MPQNTYPYVSAFFLYLRLCLILTFVHLIVIKVILSDKMNCNSLVLN